MDQTFPCVFLSVNGAFELYTTSCTSDASDVHSSNLPAAADGARTFSYLVWKGTPAYPLGENLKVWGNLRKYLIPGASYIGKDNFSRRERCLMLAFGKSRNKLTTITGFVATRILTKGPPRSNI